VQERVGVRKGETTERDDCDVVGSLHSYVPNLMCKGTNVHGGNKRIQRAIAWVRGAR